MSEAEGSGKLVVRRRISATREELFDAWTDPEGMRDWMCPGEITSAEVVMDLRVGGSFLITMRTATEAYEHRGEFTIIDRPSKLAFTWVAKATNWRPTLVTVELLQIGEEETELVLTHEKFPTKETRDQYMDGWGQIVDRLARHLRPAR
jgi:uncharacterized protein YndB with AHSA1/START domain